MAYCCDDIVRQAAWTFKDIAGTPMFIVFGHIGDKILNVGVASACKADVLHGVLQEVVTALTMGDFEALDIDLEGYIESCVVDVGAGAEDSVQLVFVLATVTSWYDKEFGTFGDSANRLS